MSAGLPLAAAVAIGWLGAYLLLVRRVKSWQLRRTLCFALGAALLGGSLALPDEPLAAHMAAHTTILWAAGLLVAGLPLSLAARARIGLREPLADAARSRIARALTGPAIAATLFVAVSWAIHFGPLFRVALDTPLAHAGEHVVLLLSAAMLWAAVLPGAPRPSGTDSIESALLALGAIAATEPIGALYMARGDRVAGVLMILSGVPLAFAAVAAIWRHAAREERRRARIEAPA